MNGRTDRPEHGESESGVPRPRFELPESDGDDHVAESQHDDRSDWHQEVSWNCSRGSQIQDAAAVEKGNDDPNGTNDFDTGRWG
ncbi:hypothetical protein JCM9743_20490 [Natrinema sp. JCM 9743]